MLNLFVVVRKVTNIMVVSSRYGEREGERERERGGGGERERKRARNLVPCTSISICSPLFLLLLNSACLDLIRDGKALPMV